MVRALSVSTGRRRGHSTAAAPPPGRREGEAVGLRAASVQLYAQHASSIRYMASTHTPLSSPAASFARAALRSDSGRRHATAPLSQVCVLPDPHQRAHRISRRSPRPRQAAHRVRAAQLPADSRDAALGEACGGGAPGAKPPAASNPRLTRVPPLAPPLLGPGSPHADIRRGYGEEALPPCRGGRRCASSRARWRQIRRRSRSCLPRRPRSYRGSLTSIAARRRTSARSPAPTASAPSSAMGAGFLGPRVSESSHVLGQPVAIGVARLRASV